MPEPKACECYPSRICGDYSEHHLCIPGCFTVQHVGECARAGEYREALEAFKCLAYERCPRDGQSAFEFIKEFMRDADTAAEEEDGGEE